MSLSYETNGQHRFKTSAFFPRQRDPSTSWREDNDSEQEKKMEAELETQTVVEEKPEVTQTPAAPAPAESVTPAEYDHPSELPDDIREPEGAKSAETEVAAVPGSAPAPATPQEVEFSKLPDKWLVSDGNGGFRTVSKEEIGSILPNLENITGWQKAYTERDQRLKEEQRQLEAQKQSLTNDWSWAVRDLAYRDPTFYQEIAQSFNRRVNPAAAQPQPSFDLPADVKGDPMAEALAKKFQSAFESVNSRFESVIQSKDQQVQEALNRVQNLELILGHQSRAQQMQLISDKAKALGITPDAGFFQRVQDIEQRNGLRLYDDNFSNPSAFGTAVTEILARRTSGSSQPSVQKKPQPTMPVRGSAQDGMEPLRPEEEFGFKAYLQESGGKATVAQFRRDMEKFNSGR